MLSTKLKTQPANSNTYFGYSGTHRFGSWVVSLRSWRFLAISSWQSSTPTIHMY
jgi:hypothetical protein